MKTAESGGPSSLWARSPGGLGPGPPGLGARPCRAWGLFPKPLKLRTSARAWRRRGCRLKRLLRRWGNEAGIPPLPPPPGCKGERKRVFTLSAFGNHPTRPPRSADGSIILITKEKQPSWKLNLSSLSSTPIGEATRFRLEVRAHQSYR